MTVSEEWRRTDPALFSALDQPAQKSASLQMGWEGLPEDAARSGVLLADLADALKRFPEKVKPHLFSSGASEGLAKFAALHRAREAQGLFCFVPDGVKVARPIKSRIEAPGGEGLLFPHLLLVAGRGSAVTLVDERRSSSAKAGTIVSDEMTEIFVGEGASVCTVRLQRWGAGVRELYLQRAILEKEARFLNILVWLGSEVTKASVETVLRGAGARSELLGILFGSEDQHYDFHTVQDHESPGTTSDLLYKSALRDRAKAITTGLIRIARHAQKSDAYQANRNLLLSDGAKADSIPMLEIEADDVRCTHGVAVGPVDREILFYLMSRGIPRATAEALIVGGFFEPVLKRIPLEGLRQELAGEISRRLAKGEIASAPDGASQ